jgi:hypothetical protein
MKGKEIEKVPHCIIRFYHNLWYKDDKSPQLFKENNISFSNPLKTHCFDISFPEYMCYDTLEYKNVQLC